MLWYGTAWVYWSVGSAHFKVMGMEYFMFVATLRTLTIRDRGKHSFGNDKPYSRDIPWMISCLE